MGPIGAFGNMDHQQSRFRQFFGGNGNRRIAGRGHVLDLGDTLIGQVAAHDPVPVGDADEDASSGGIGKGHQLFGQIAVDALLELKPIALPLFQEKL